MIKKYFALSLIAASVAVAGCSSDDDDDDTPIDTSPTAVGGVGGSVYDAIFASDQHTAFLAAINAAGMADKLDDEANDYTVFAPDDTAFAAVTDLTTDTDELKRLVEYHVVAGTFDSEALAADIAAATEDSAATLATLIDGESLTLGLSTDGQGIAVNEVAVTAADLVATVDEGEEAVGVVHTLASVLDVPEEEVGTDDGTDGGTDGGTTDGGTTDGGGSTGAVEDALVAAGNYTQFLELSSSFGQAFEDNAWTVFAPTDEAIAESGIPDVQNLIAVNDGAMTADDLIEAGSITTNKSQEFAVSGTADELMVGGVPAVLIATGANGTTVYSLDGILGAAVVE